MEPVGNSVQTGLCNRREHRPGAERLAPDAAEPLVRDEEAGDFFNEKRESVAVPTVERFEEEKVPDSSSNAAPYCIIRV